MKAAEYSARYTVSLGHPFNPKLHFDNVVLITFCHVNRFKSINTLGKIQTGAPPSQSDVKEQLLYVQFAPDALQSGVEAASLLEENVMLLAR